MGVVINLPFTTNTKRNQPFGVGSFVMLKSGGFPRLVVALLPDDKIRVLHPDDAEPEDYAGRCFTWLPHQSTAEHEFLQRKMSRLKSDPQQRVEAHPIMPPPIPPKHELVEIRLQIPLTKPMINAQPKPLKVREDPMNPWHEDMSRHLADHAGIVSAVGHSIVGRVPVSPDGAALGGGAGHERVKRLTVVTGNRHQPNTSRRFAVLKFDCASNGDLADGATPLTATNGLILGAIGNGALVDLDYARQGIAVGIDHCLTQAVKQEPRTLIGADAELCLKLERGNSVGVRGDQMGSKEPSAER